MVGVIAERYGRTSNNGNDKNPKTQAWRSKSSPKILSGSVKPPKRAADTYGC